MYGPPRQPRGRGRGRGGSTAGEAHRNAPSPGAHFTAEPDGGSRVQRPSSPVVIGYHQYQQQQQSPAFRNSDFFPSPYRRVSREKVEAAVEKAWRDLRGSGKSVTSWKVSQSALLSLQVDSWASLGFKYMNSVPLLDSLMAIEGKVNTFIHCFVSVRKITSVHELGVEICKSEGVEKFEELGLGPLLRHPLVEHYFSIPLDVDEVFEITIEDILNCLGTYLYRCKNKEIPVEEFINYVAEKKSVSPKDKLGLRIRSFGLYIKCIKDARRAESAILKEYPQKMLKEKNALDSSLEKKESFNANLSLQKQRLDGLFDATSSSFETVSQIDEDADILKLDNKNGNSNSNNQGEILSQAESSKRKCQCNCLAQSRVVELSVLGMKLVIPSDLVTKVDWRKANKLDLSDEDISRFIMTWKEVCQNYSVAEVVAMMLSFYVQSDKRKRKMQRLFLSYPAVGLLNVVVRSLKCGLIDGSCSLRPLGKDEFIGPSSSQALEIEDTPQANSGPMVKDSEGSCNIGYRVTVDDVVNKVINYVELNSSQPVESEFPLGKQLALIKKYHDCEMWVATQFSVEKFTLLGYGNLFELLEHNISLLTPVVFEYFIGDFNEKHTLNVAMLQDQVQVMLVQALGSLVDGGTLTKDYVYLLLKKQFPTVSFHLFGNEIEKDFSYLVNRGKDSGSSNCVIFSATLLCCSGNLEVSRMLTDVVCYASCMGSVSSKVAMECLLNAPMLSDLQSWSHWDLLFAPSLGPLLPWLLNGVQTKKLLCIATSDGKLIRVDHSVTLDEFLEASIKGSSFQAAVKLLSLLALYGGRNKVPLSLLQCYAQRAIDDMVRNSTVCTEAQHIDKYLHHRASREKFDLSSKLNGDSVYLYSLSTAAVNKQYNGWGDGLNVASNFILNCLGHLPSEFRSFAADVLLSGLRSFTRDAYSVILNVAKHTGYRCMLHDVGLSLGINEWIEDYHEFSSTSPAESFTLLRTGSKVPESFHPLLDVDLKPAGDASRKLLSEDCKTLTNVNAVTSLVDQSYHGFDDLNNEILKDGSIVRSSEDHDVFMSEDGEDQVATLIIESIRRDEFGIDSSLQHSESNLLEKQHARLGRALHHLSQELYSQDSHLLLELVQNADDNSYPEKVDPALVFILNSTGIVVLNNERGFSEQNIRALCDVGNSTKKRSGAGYIGRKGIGFKSVFRVSDAPEIHSNGFHVKFDINDGQIGFILPTIISPCDISIFKSLISSEDAQTDSTSWNTCIMLPFGSKFKGGKGISSIISMFQDLHPSLLLFLHRLRCIIFRNMLSGSCTIMRRETLGDGIIKVSRGNEKMSWLVVSQELQANKIRSDVQATEISVAFTLQESDNDEYKPQLSQQPVFSFLPLRTYGLKFILQGDFVLPSSREEVDGNSAWNQWLLSEFPSLFITAERSFCALPCFKESPGKAVTAFMSFVPLVGEVHGFFSCLPHLIINKLRSSNCFLFEGNNVEWIPPCRVLRGWDEQVRILLPDSLLLQHLGLGYLSKDIILSDALANALGVEDYGPKILVDIMSSICHRSDGIKLLGLDWLSSWLIELNNALSIYSTGYNIPNSGAGFDFIKSLQRMPLIPLSDGSYTSVAEGPVWLPCDFFGLGLEGRCGPKDFPRLFVKLRTVSPLLFSTGPSCPYTMQETRIDKVMQMLHKIGVHQLSAHEVIRTYILPNLSDDVHINEDKDLMIEYISFIILHFQYSCFDCHNEKANIISELRNRSVILTNHGYKCPSTEPVHFNTEFGNSIDIHRLIDHEDTGWHEIDAIYLNHPSMKAIPSGLVKWREFFLELGVIDFVQVILFEKMLDSSSIPQSLKYDESHGSNLQNGGGDVQIVIDWDSPELVHLLSKISSEESLEKSKYLLEILDRVWDSYFDAKSASSVIRKSAQNEKQPITSFIKTIQGFKWVASSTDEELHYPKDLFDDCETVRSILGTYAPYAVPKVSSEKLLEDIGFKTQVTFEDAVTILQSWQSFETPFMASISQMSKFYHLISVEVAISKGKITNEFKSNCKIFIPFSNNARYDETVAGTFVSASELYWHDPTGCVDWTKEIILHDTSIEDAVLTCKALAAIYPDLRDFFLDECGVPEMPPFGSYLHILLQLSSVALPSQAAPIVFQVFLKLADDLNGGIVKYEEISYLKESFSKLENKVLPTVQDKWVSLHPSFGLICFPDDEELRHQFEHLEDIDFLHFGDLNNEQKELLSGKIIMLLKTIGVPSLSEVVSREAISYGSGDNKEKVCLVNWVLPYAQRYLFKFHPKTYFHLKEFGLEKINQLQVAVVDKLFYRNNLKGHNSVSKKRFECSCLLQGSVLYMTSTSDSHPIFLELSRLFFYGAPELHLANFLLMIMNMAESGSTVEQIEYFVLTSQKVPQLPDEEPVWSPLSSCSIFEDKTSHQFDLPITIIRRKSSTYSRKQGSNSSWPPPDWKGKLDLNAPQGGCFKTLSGEVPSVSEMKEISSPGGPSHTQDVSVSPELGERTVQDDLDTSVNLAVQDAEISKGHSSLVQSSSLHDSQRNACFETELVTIDSVGTKMSSINAEFDHGKDRLGLRTLIDGQSHATGRWGEAMAYKYFSAKLNSSPVKWVNELKETGLPYDLIIGEDGDNVQHIEVKTTTSTNKDWFPITAREWQFATDKGDLFSIAHVVLLDTNNAKITVFKNPLKLCQQKVLHLAILMSEQDNNSHS